MNRPTEQDRGDKHTDLSLGILYQNKAFGCFILGRNVRNLKPSNLVGRLHPDVIWGRDYADVGPPEVVYDAEQHPCGPR